MNINGEIEKPAGAVATSSRRIIYIESGPAQPVIPATLAVIAGR